MDFGIAQLLIIIFITSFLIRAAPVIIYGYPIDSKDTVDNTINMLYLPKYPIVMLNYDRTGTYAALDPVLKSLSYRFYLQDNPPFFYLTVGGLANLILPFTKGVNSGFLATAIVYSFLPIILFLFLRFVTRDNILSFFGGLILAISPSTLRHLFNGDWALITGSMLFLLSIFLSIKYIHNPQRKNFFLLLLSLVFMITCYVPYIFPYAISMVFYSATRRNKKPIFKVLSKIFILSVLISIPFLINFINSYLISEVPAQQSAVYLTEILEILALSNILLIFSAAGAIGILISFIKRFKIEESIQIFTPVIGILLFFLLGDIFLHLSSYPNRVFSSSTPIIIALLSSYAVYFFYEYIVRFLNTEHRLNKIVATPTSRPVFTGILVILIFAASIGPLSFMFDIKPFLTNDKYDALQWIRNNTEKDSTVYFIGFFSHWKSFSYRNATNMFQQEVGGRIQWTANLIEGFNADYIVLSPQIFRTGYAPKIIEIAKLFNSLNIPIVYGNGNVLIFQIKPEQRQQFKNRIETPNNITVGDE